MTFPKMLALSGVALLVMVANVLASILYMVLYGHVIDPGHNAQYYNDHIQVAGPYCSIVAGIPIMFFAGYWVAGWWQRTLGVRGAWLVWLIYGLIDLAIMLIVGMTCWIGAVFVVSFATKFAAVNAGASMRLKPPTSV